MLNAPPAEKSATWGVWAKASSMDMTTTSSPLKRTVLPTDCEDATGSKHATGKSRASSTSNMVRPTMPVAPTTATFKGVSLAFITMGFLGLWMTVRN